MKYSTTMRIKAIATAVLLLLSMTSKIASSASDRPRISRVTAMPAASYANLAK